MLEATHFQVSGERLTVAYRIEDPDPEARAQHIVIEQTIEFPEHLVGDDSIRAHLIGRLENFAKIDERAARADISYAVEATGVALPQMLNVIFGNISLQPGIRVIDIRFPDVILERFRGPRFGRAGLRALLNEPDYPLFCTALKPLGLGPEALARQAGEYARGGFHLIKDDDGLANQPMAPFRERVPRILEAVARENARRDAPALYLPALNGASDELVENARWAVEQGAGGFLVLAGIAGLDTMRRFAEDDSLGVPILAHPSMLGSFVTSPSAGIAHSVIFGTLPRLAGADATIFPSYGGRFAFAESDCRAIVAATGAPLGTLRTNFPSPGGGMRFRNIPDMVRTYGRDVMHLVGGALHDGDDGIAVRCRRLIDSVHAAIDAGGADSGAA